jgi:peptidoglycan L-alanyl-D-glutamate endopeptidase CwlK
MINSRNLDDLIAPARSRAKAFVAECSKRGIDVLITSTYRDSAAQAALYAQGRTVPGPKVTNAKPGQSWHNWRCAFDFVPIVNGKAQWNDIATFQRCGEIAESVGLEWAGRWRTFKELAHCQYTGGLTLADLQSGKTIS